MRNDIFISYAHEDLPHLEQLRKHLGLFRNQYGAWDDDKIPHGSSWWPQIFAALEQAKVAVLLVSADFLNSDFVVEQELSAILKRAREGRLKVEWVLVSACAYQDTDVGRLQALYNPEIPMNRLDAGAQQAAWSEVATKIRESCKAMEAAFPVISPAAPKGDRKCVLLAQVTDDLEEEVAQVRSYLAQYKDEVLLLPSGVYPQGGRAFKNAFESDLAQAGAFVQLLGPRPGRMDIDLPEGYTRWQFERAKSEMPRIEMMQWRRPDLDTSTISNPAYKEVVNSETVVASGLEAFKGQILAWARKRPPKAREVRPSYVFIDAAEKDFEIAQRIREECKANNLSCHIPPRGATAEEIQQELEADLSECGGLIFVYGNTTVGWLLSHFRRLHRVRPKETPPQLLALCVGPPPKPDPGVDAPNMDFIDCSQGWNMDQIRKVLAKLNQ